MKALPIIVGVGVLVLGMAWLPGCNSNDSTTPPPPVVTDLPDIPVPASVNDLLPAKSAEIAVGLSNPVEHFTPLVSQLQMMADDGSEPWRTYATPRNLTMACAGGTLPEYSCNQALASRSYITAPPRLLHLRYWRLLKQVTLAPGTEYSREEVISYGTSTTHEESREFSQTIGVSVTAGGGWGPFSASVTASYEQTSTQSELNSVTFSEESTMTETYSINPDPDHDRIYALWQLVDTFRLVDEDSVRIADSPTLAHVKIPDIVDIEFPSNTVIRQSVTKF